MNQDDIQQFFKSLTTGENKIPPDQMEILLKLINLTIQFRDDLARDTGETLSVEETRMALNIYLSALQNGHLPGNIEKKIGKLIALWLKEIDGKTF